MGTIVESYVCGWCAAPSGCDCVAPRAPRELATPDWGYAFLEPWGYTRFGVDVVPADVHVEALDPGLPTTRFTRADIVEIAFLAEGVEDGAPWIVVARLRCGRWAYVAYTVQITGEVYWTAIVAASRERLWWWALTDDDRDRLAPQMTGDERDEELVQLDALLESSDPEARARAEARAVRLHGGGGAAKSGTR